MKKLTGEWISKAEDDFASARELLAIKPILSDQICFHCQQAVEKYLKAMLQEHKLPIQRTHDITVLLDQLVPADLTLRSLRRGTKTLTRYAVDCVSEGSHFSRANSQKAWIANASHKIVVTRKKIVG
jgi:HEPN domain-containing protein